MHHTFAYRFAREAIEIADGAVSAVLALVPTWGGSDYMLEMEPEEALEIANLLIERCQQDGFNPPRWVLERRDTLRLGDDISPIDRPKAKRPCPHTPLLDWRQSLDWTPTGDWGCVGVFARVPVALQQHFGELSKDISPAHVTILYLGPVPYSIRGGVVAVIRSELKRLRPEKWHLKSVETFTNSDEWVHYVAVEVPLRLRAARRRILKTLKETFGFEPSSSFRDWVPHITLAYAEPGTAYTGDIATSQAETERSTNHSFGTGSMFPNSIQFGTSNPCSFDPGPFEIWGADEHHVIVPRGVPKVLRDRGHVTRLLKSQKGEQKTGHKYKSRKMGPDGKWIYDYGDGNGGTMQTVAEDEPPTRKQAVEQNEQEINKKEETNQTEPESSDEKKHVSRMNALYRAWNQLGVGFKVTTPSGAEWEKKPNGRFMGPGGVELSAHHLVEHFMDVEAGRKHSERQTWSKTFQKTFFQFLEGFVKGSNPHWERQFDERSGQKGALAAERESLERLGALDPNKGGDWIKAEEETRGDKDAKDEPKKEQPSEPSEPEAVRKARKDAKEQPSAHEEGGEKIEESDALDTKAQGREHDVILAGGAGGNERVKAQYKVIDASKLIPSHDPTTFSKHDKYTHENERDYSKDGGERAKVLMNAQNLDPALLVNTDPTNANGPPLVSPTGEVYGGNSRAMSMQLASTKHPEKMEAYKAYLTENAGQFGIDPKDFEGVKNPVLVREVVPGQKIDAALLIRQANESLTQSKDQVSEAVGASRKLSPETVNALAQKLDPTKSLTSFLGGSGASDFLVGLAKDGVIGPRDASKYYTGKGAKQRLNATGVSFVQDVMLGKLLGDGGADALRNASASEVEALKHAAPYALAASAHGDSYNLSESVRNALDAKRQLEHLSKKENKGHARLTSNSSTEDVHNSVDQLRNTLTDPHPILKDGTGRLLLEAMVRNPQKHKLAKVFQSVAQAAQSNPEGQASLFGPVDPKEVIHNALSEHLGDSSAADILKEHEARGKVQKSRKGGLVGLVSLSNTAHNLYLRSRPLYSRLEYVNGRPFVKSLACDPAYAGMLLGMDDVDVVACSRVGDVYLKDSLSGARLRVTTSCLLDSKALESIRSGLERLRQS